MTTTDQAKTSSIPEVSYVIEDEHYGHLAEMRVDPIGLFQRVREECGDIGRFRLAERDVVLVSGAAANEQFFGAPESTLDQAAACPFMTPTFGEGTDALAYVDPHLDIEPFRTRDAARIKLVELVQAIIDHRVARAESYGGSVPKEERDLLDVLISVDYSADLITGIFISMMFAGHHTSSGTAALDPGRYLDGRQEDALNRWIWIPFGAGKHRCGGSAFAMMHLTAIFSVILRDYEFEMVQPSESYVDDVSKMVIQLQQPCRVSYRRRTGEWAR